MILFSLAFPPLLMVLALLMQHIEQPLRDRQIVDRVVEVLHQRPVDDVEHLVTTQAADSLRRHWRRQQRLTRLQMLRTSGRR